MEQYYQILLDICHYQKCMLIVNCPKPDSRGNDSKTKATQQS